MVWVKTVWKGYQQTTLEFIEKDMLNPMTQLTLYYPLCLMWFIVSRAGSRISGKGGHNIMYKGMEIRFADFILFFLNIPWKWNNLVSLRPNYFIFIGYLEMGGGGGGAGSGVRVNPWTPLNLPLSVFFFDFVELGIHYSHLTCWDETWVVTST